MTSFTEPINPFNWLQRWSLSDDFYSFWTFSEARDSTNRRRTDVKRRTNSWKHDCSLLLGSNQPQFPPGASNPADPARFSGGKLQMSDETRNAALMWEVEPQKWDLHTPNVARAFKKLQKHVGSDLLSDDKRNNQRRTR